MAFPVKEDSHRSMLQGPLLCLPEPFTPLQKVFHEVNKTKPSDSNLLHNLHGKLIVISSNKRAVVAKEVSMLKLSYLLCSGFREFQFPIVYHLNLVLQPFRFIIDTKVVVIHFLSLEAFTLKVFYLYIEGIWRQHS